ncbi:MAG: FHA domain-containing protein [bacterium]
MTEVKVCPNCGKENEINSNRCQECKTPLGCVDLTEAGASLKKTADDAMEAAPARSWRENKICPVPDCGAENPADAVRCDYCHHAFGDVRDQGRRDAPDVGSTGTPVVEWPWGPLEIGERFPVGMNPEFCPAHYERFKAYGNVSNYHAEFRVSGADVTIIDLDSTNKTFVNERPLTPHVDHRLYDGDTLRFAADLKARLRR